MEVVVTFIERFTEALTQITGKVPPADLVALWVAGDESHCDTGADTLQNWAVDYAPLSWTTGIGVIEAAEALADAPVDGFGHERR